MLHPFLTRNNKKLFSPQVESKVSRFYIEDTVPKPVFACLHKSSVFGYSHRRGRGKYWLSNVFLRSRWTLIQTASLPAMLLPFMRKVRVRLGAGRAPWDTAQHRFCGKPWFRSARRRVNSK